MRIDASIPKITALIDDAEPVESAEWNEVKENALSVTSRWESHWGNESMFRLVARINGNCIDSQLLSATNDLPLGGRWLHESGLFEIAGVADLPVTCITVDAHDAIL